jgi:hypothetical protein
MLQKRFANVILCVVIGFNTGFRRSFWIRRNHCIRSVIKLENGLVNVILLAIIGSGTQLRPGRWGANKLAAHYMEANWTSRR